MPAQTNDYEMQWREREAERLANWARPELSCDGIVENQQSQGAAWPGQTIRQESDAGRQEHTSPAKSNASGTLKWTHVVRQLQKSR